jgi:hypothetical protein
MRTSHAPIDPSDGRSPAADKPFASLPAMSRPLDELAFAHEYTLLALRLPLHHRRLRKARPKPKLYDAAIQPGLAILGAFAQQMGTRQAIVRLENGKPSAISFQPRPFEANWTREHALSPEALHDPTTDRLLLSDTLPRVSTGDMVHLAAKIALAVSISTRPTPTARRRSSSPQRSQRSRWSASPIGQSPAMPPGMTRVFGSEIAKRGVPPGASCLRHPAPSPTGSTANNVGNA